MDSFIPDADHINALPGPLRRYIRPAPVRISVWCTLFFGLTRPQQKEPFTLRQFSISKNIARIVNPERARDCCACAGQFLQWVDVEPRRASKCQSSALLSSASRIADDHSVVV